MIPQWVSREVSNDEIQIAKRVLSPNIPLISRELSQIRKILDFQWKLTQPNVTNLRGAGESITIAQIPELVDTECNSLLIYLINEEILRFQSVKYIAKSYPIGHCAHITQIIFRLIDNPDIIACFPGLQNYLKFKSNGGNSRIIWGICRDKYFQTAMQWGPYYVDVANDTVDIHKPKVEIFELSDPGCNFNFVQDLYEYLSVMESYWERKVYTYSTFPQLIDTYPIITLCNVTKKLNIITNHVFKYLIKTDPNATQTLKKFDMLPKEIEDWLNENANFNTSISNNLAGSTMEAKQKELNVITLNHFFSKNPCIF